VTKVYREKYIRENGYVRSGVHFTSSAEFAESFSEKGFDLFDQGDGSWIAMRPLGMCYYEEEE
jgi:hypothetical protein